MTVVDELMTPGCPNCAVKHLSACIERVVNYGGPFSTGDEGHRCADQLLARAYINFIESEEGYTSHFDYAIGLLVEAEESSVHEAATNWAKSIRELRVKFMTGSFPLRDLYDMCYEQLAAAHYVEAFRELPVLGDNFNPLFPGYDQAGVDKIREIISWVKREYFCAGLSEEYEGEEGGENIMATKKAVKPVAKKAEKPVAKKATKACSKGGKCKK